MALYFKDRIPEPIHGENSRYYDAVGSSGSVKLPDFKLVLKNNIPSDRTGDPVNAGNLNFASGNIALLAGVPDETKAGTVLSFANGYAIPTKTNRPVAATGLEYAAAPFNNGFFRLANNKLLVMYSNRVSIATVDFAAKTVSLTPPGLVDVNTYGTFADLAMIRDYDDDPTALCCFVASQYDYGGRYTPVTLKITGDVPVFTRAGYIFDSGRTVFTNPVGFGNTSMLICSATSSQFYVSLINCGGANTSLTKQVEITGITGATLRSLFGYDTQNGKYLLIYTISNNVYALPVNVAVNGDITLGSPQLLGDTTNTLYDMGSLHGGTDRHVVNNGKILVTGSTSTYGPAKIQLLRVNQSSGIVTKGAIISLPVFNMNNGNSHITYNIADDKIYLTGGDYENNGIARLLEIKINGMDLQISKTQPFLPTGLSASVNYSALKSAAYENPDNPGEFLFIQHLNATPAQSLSFWFGYKSDYASPNNIIGIALDEPTDGYVRLQSTAKNLPGVYDNLTAGRFYTAGNNGALAQYTGAAGTTPLGFATGTGDLQFFGAAGL